MTRRALPLATLAVVVVLLAVALVAGGGRAAQGATDLISGSTGPAAGSTRTTVAADVTTTTVADVNADGERRVVIVGDSLVVGAEDELTAVFRANGVEATFIAVSGTGILTDQGVRATELADALAELGPDVVVIESCCNYDGAYRLADGTTVGSDTDLLWSVWADQARTMTRTAEASGADVYWVLTPQALTGGWYSDVVERIEHFNAIYQSLGAGLVDWQAALYPDGTTAGHDDVRAGDGLHLSATGDALVAAATWSAIAGSFS